MNKARPAKPLCAGSTTPGRPAPADSAWRSLRIESLIREGAALKKEIESRTMRLRSINQALAECASFKPGQGTAALFGAGYRVKVRLHDNISWDQEKILEFRRHLPEEKFCELFKTVYEPASKKTIDGFIAHADPDLSTGLKWCMTLKPAAPQVTYEKLEDGKSS